MSAAAGAASRHPDMACCLRGSLAREGAEEGGGRRARWRTRRTRVGGREEGGAARWRANRLRERVERNCVRNPSLVYTCALAIGAFGQARWSRLGHFMVSASVNRFCEAFFLTTSVNEK